MSPIILSRSLTFSLLLGLGACSAKPEDGSSGRCALSCANARVGAAEFVLQPLNGAISFACTADFATAKSIAVPVNAPVQVRYLLYEPVPTFGNSADPNAGASSGASTGAASSAPATPTAAPPLLTNRPVGGVGFDPVVFGSMAVSKTAKDFQIGNGQISSAKYAGVVTPPSEWCSDSCGIITFEVWPNCMAGTSNTITAGVQAGAAQLKSAANPIQITITNGQAAP